MQITSEWAAIILLLALLVLIGITYISWDNYRRCKTNFTLGLLTFAFLILINRFTWIIFWLSQMPQYMPPSLLTFINLNSTNIVFLGGLIQFIGLLILLRIIME